MLCARWIERGALDFFRPPGQQIARWSAAVEERKWVGRVLVEKVGPRPILRLLGIGIGRSWLGEGMAGQEDYEGAAQQDCLWISGHEISTPCFPIWLQNHAKVSRSILMPGSIH